MLHIAILGSGSACRLHARLLRRRKDVRLSFASRSIERAEEMRRKYGGERSYATYEAALGDRHIDVVLIATPTVLHFHLALAALRQGKHVIVEKPAFMSVAEADCVSAAASAEGRTVLVAENYFYKPVTEFLRRTIAGGELGDVRFVRLDAAKRQAPVGWRGDPSLSGGGALFEAGIHWINFAGNIGLDIADVSVKTVGAGGGPDLSSLVTIGYANGGAGTITHSWEIPAPFGHLRLSQVYGTRGAVTFESNGLAWWKTGRRKTAGAALRDPFGYETMMDDFLRSLATGANARFTLAMARRDIELIENGQRGQTLSVTTRSGNLPNGSSVIF